ncbi:MAG: hypothetical protein PHH44_01845 [bacterium]|nr:hypothetical protein [bacterium]
MKCPKCGYDNKDGAEHCDLCKEILVKPPEYGRPRTDLYQSRQEMSAPPRPSRPVSSSAGNVNIDNMEAIKFGWEAMKEHLWLFIGIGAAAAGIYGIEWFIQLIVTGGAKGHSFGSVFISLAFGYLNAVIFTLGYNKVCIKMADGEETEFSDLFSCFHLGGRFILSSLIMGLMFVPIVVVMGISAVILKKALILGIFGMIAAIVAISIIIMRFIFISYLVVDKEMDAMDCVKGSWNMTKGAVWDLSIFFSLQCLVIIAGALCLGVGLIAAIPTTSIATAYYYRQLSKRI